MRPTWSIWLPRNLGRLRQPRRRIPVHGQRFFRIRLRYSSTASKLRLHFASGERVSTGLCVPARKRGYETWPVPLYSELTCSGTQPPGPSATDITAPLSLTCAETELHKPS